MDIFLPLNYHQYDLVGRDIWLESEIVLWCHAHIGRFALSKRKLPHGDGFGCFVVIVFEKEGDMIAFKLRWL